MPSTPITQDKSKFETKWPPVSVRASREACVIEITQRQVDKAVADLCIQLAGAIRETGTEKPPTNLRGLAFDKDSVETALKIGLHSAGIWVTPPPPK